MKPSSAPAVATAPRAIVLGVVVLASACHSSAAPLDAGSGVATPPQPSATPIVVAPPQPSSPPQPPNTAPPSASPAVASSPIDFSAMNAALAGKKPAPSCAPIGKGVRYDVGSARTPSLDEVPWTSLAPGDVVCVPYRPEPYRAKIFFVTRGAKDAPIRLVGLRGPHGERPIIDGDGATTSHFINPPAGDRWLEPFGVISMVTHFAPPKGAPWGWHPGWITITGLRIQHARPAYTFTDSAGKSQHYPGFSSAIYINPGDDVVIEDCEVTDSQVGIFAKSFEKTPNQIDRVTERLTLRGNYIHGNGDGKALGIHNVYIEARGCDVIGNSMVHQAGSVGANYKSRCAHERIFGNRIEGGSQGLLVLIDPQSGWDSLGVAPDFEPTVVAGNLLLNPFENGALGSPLVAFGGDSYRDEDHYRKSLIFYANTVLGRSHGGSRIPVISTAHLTRKAPSITAWFSSNLIDNPGDGVAGTPLKLALATGAGNVVVDHGFNAAGIPAFDEYDRGAHGTVAGWTPAAGSAGIPAGPAEPRPIKGSPLIDAGAPFTSLPAESRASTVTDFALYEPSGSIEDPWYRARAVNGAVDIGAYEAAP
ncbi:MAG: hypothetical protein ABJE95_25420 [Byssovorax sp.]